MLVICVQVVDNLIENKCRLHTNLKKERGQRLMVSCPDKKPRAGEKRLSADVERGERNWLYKMLSKNCRVGRKVFPLVLKGGKRMSLPLFSVAIFDEKTAEPARFSVVVSKRIARTAVMRNKMKRRVYGAIQKELINKGCPKGKIIVFFAKNNLVAAKPAEIAQEIQSFGNKFFNLK